MIRGLEEELAGRKYAHVERERRFLVDRALRPELAGHPSILIEDRYIVGSRMRLRRMTDSVTGRIVLKLGKKYEAIDPLARPIVTTYLSDAEFALLANLPAHPLFKRRYPVGNFSIDLFEGALAGLELAEIEAPDAASLMAVVAPAWAAMEVGKDPFFEGGNLAKLDRMALRARLEDLGIGRGQLRPAVAAGLMRIMRRGLAPSATTWPLNKSRRGWGSAACTT